MFMNFKYNIVICDADKMPKCSEMDNFDKKKTGWSTEQNYTL